MALTDTDLRIAGNVRAELARRNIPRKRVIEVLGFSPDSLGRRTNGETPWSGGELAAISSTFDIPIEKLTAQSDD